MGEFWNHDGCKEIPQILDWWDKYLWSLFFETTLVDYFVFAYHNTFSVSFKKYSIATVRFKWLSCIPIYQRKYILNHLSSNWFTRQYCMFLLLCYMKREVFPGIGFCGHNDKSYQSMWLLWLICTISTKQEKYLCFQCDKYFTYSFPYQTMTNEKMSIRPIQLWKKFHLHF